MKKILYHGTNKRFEKFDTSKIGLNYKADTIGFFFTSDIKEAKEYALGAVEYHKEGEAIVVEAEVTIESPFLKTAIYCNAHQSYDLDNNKFEVMFKEDENNVYDSVIIHNKIATTKQLKESWMDANKGGDLFMILNEKQINITNHINVKI